MLAPPHRHKRQRSPSPPLSPDLASPLDVLLKRRRREELTFSSPIQSPVHDTLATGSSPFSSHLQHHQQQQQQQNYSNDYFNLPSSSTSNINEESNSNYPHAESSSQASSRRSMAGIERRRTKQWEKQNAPPSTSLSQPTPPPTANYSYLTPNARNAHSQPDPMSSSPIRNQRPSSSPFKSKKEDEEGDIWNITKSNHGKHQLHHDYGQLDGAQDEQQEEEMDMNEDEMKREWGEAYEKQNWLLHSLHVARMHSQHHNSNQIHNLNHNYHHPSYHDTASHPNHTPPHAHTNHTHSQTNSHANRIRTPLHPTISMASTSTFVSTSDPSLTSPHPAYRNHPSHPDSSPLNSQFPSVELRSPSHGDMMVEDDDMEILDHDFSNSGGMEDEIIRKRYEETNRLLGELEVVRRNRWGQ